MRQPFIPRVERRQEMVSSWPAKCFTVKSKPKTPTRSGGGGGGAKLENLDKMENFQEEKKTTLTHASASESATDI